MQQKAVNEVVTLFFTCLLASAGLIVLFNFYELTAEIPEYPLHNVVGITSWVLIGIIATCLKFYAWLKGMAL